METGNRIEESADAGNLACGRMPASVVEQGLETAILEYAISTFPYTDAFECLPGYSVHELPDLIECLISEGIVKVGFYYEEMQDHLTIFYFLRVGGEKYVVLGLNPNEVCVSISEIDGIFRLDDEQYINLLQIPLC